MKRIYRIVLVCCCIALLWNPPGSCDEATRPILSLDLRKFGYLHAATERDLRAYTFLQDSVAFLDDGALAVSFYRKNDQPGLSRRGSTPGSEVLFHSVLLDPVAGNVKSERTWGNAGNSNGLLALENGSFLIQDDVWVKVYSREMKELASKKLEVPGDILPRFAASPSGRSLYEFQDWYDAKRGWLTRIDMLDPATLATKKSKLTPGHKFESVSDTRVVYLPTASSDALRLFVSNMEDSAPAKRPELFDPNSSTARDLSKSRCKSATFIDDTILAISGDCPFVILIRSGEEFDEIHSAEYRVGGEIRPSRGGQRFVFSRTNMKDRPSRITSLEICVYDLAQHKIVFTTPVVPLPQQKFAFAISPDGSLLAVQTDGLVHVWRVVSLQ
jgi:hypothetical protein